MLMNDFHNDGDDHAAADNGSFGMASVRFPCSRRIFPLKGFWLHQDFQELQKKDEKEIEKEEEKKKKKKKKKKRTRTREQQNRR